MSRILRDTKNQVRQGDGTRAESALQITQLLATIGKDVGNIIGCAPASLTAGILVSVLETVQVGEDLLLPQGLSRRGPFVDTP